MRKIEHLGIAVADLKKSNDLFEKLLGKGHYKTESVAGEQVETSFFQVGETKIELLQAQQGEGPIAKFIEKRGEGIHHIAFAVHNILQTMEEKSSLGFELINTQPKDGADNKKIAFFHPKSTGNVLVEMCEEKK